jgi:hypothetical protein
LYLPRDMSHLGDSGKILGLWIWISKVNTQQWFLSTKSGHKKDNFFRLAVLERWMNCNALHKHTCNITSLCFMKSPYKFLLS